MNCFDHYPWHDALMIVPGAPTMPPPQRFVKRGFYMCCVACGLTIDYCNCASQPAPDVSRPTDGGDSSLEQRVRDLKGRR